MKARNREINIFNMSLLDILCGALGAFCFMMLTLFPYYMRAQQKDRGGGSEQQAQSSNADELQRQLAEARAKLQRAEQELEQSLQRRASAGDAGALQQELQMREQQLRNAQQQLQVAQQQLQAAQQQMQNTQNQLQETEKKLKMIYPVSTQIWWFGQGDVDLYLWGTGDKGKNPPEPKLGEKMPVFFRGDQRTDCLKGPCSESWMMRDLPVNAPMKVYYILYDLKESNPVPVLGQIMTATGKMGLPEVKLDAQHRIVLVGTLVRNAQDNLEFKPAVGGSGS